VALWILHQHRCDAHAFCLLQLANAIRMLPDDSDLPDEADSLEDLAAIAVAKSVIDIELQARLLVLHDRQRTYTAAPLMHITSDLNTTSPKRKVSAANMP